MVLINVRVARIACCVVQIEHVVFGKGHMISERVYYLLFCMVTVVSILIESGLNSLLRSYFLLYRCGVLAIRYANTHGKDMLALSEFTWLLLERRGSLVQPPRTTHHVFFYHLSKSC